MKSKTKTETLPVEESAVAVAEQVWSIRRVAEYAAGGDKTARAAFRRPSFLRGVAVVLRAAQEELTTQLLSAGDDPAPQKALQAEVLAAVKRGRRFGETVRSIRKAIERSAGLDVLARLRAARQVVSCALRDRAAARFLAKNCCGLGRLLADVQKRLCDEKFPRSLSEQSARTL